MCDIKKLEKEAISATELFKPLVCDFDLLLTDAKKKTVKKQFAKGFKYLHRGFYCPSRDIEYIVTNVKRGKLVSENKVVKGDCFEYGFDEKGKMLYAHQFSNEKKHSYSYYEIMKYEGKNVLSVYGDYTGKLNYVFFYSMCTYNKQDEIIEYTVYGVDPITNNVSNIEKEIYSYNGNILETVVYHYSVKTGFYTGIYSIDRYKFLLDDNHNILNMIC